MLKVKNKKFECVKRISRETKCDYGEAVIRKTMNELIETVVRSTTSKNKMRIHAGGLFCPRDSNNNNLCSYIGIDGSEKIERCRRVRPEIYPTVTDNILTVSDFCGEALMAKFLLEKYEKHEVLGKNDYIPTCVGISIPFADIRKYAANMDCRYIDKSLTDDDIICIVKHYSEEDSSARIGEERLIYMRCEDTKNGCAVMPLHHHKPNNEMWIFYASVIRSMERGFSTPVLA